MDGELSELDWISFYENTRKIEETYSWWYFCLIIQRVIRLKTVKILARDKPLNSFINKSFSLGQYPSECKIANIIPIFKSDNRQFKTSHRPVSLVTSLSKICEEVFFFHLYNFLLGIFFFLNKLQSGFRPGDSAFITS